MRITAQVKQETRDAILAAARRLFRRQGIEAASTRAIATAAKIGVGTLFNYFPSKEALALAVASTAFAEGREQALQRLGDAGERGASVEEDLFTLVACDIRALGPLRPLVGEILDMGAGGTGSEESGAIRADRVGDAERVLARHGLASAAGPALMHLYWSLYLGVLSYWAKDASPNQEDTWALLDQGVRMFAGALRGGVDGARRD